MVVLIPVSQPTEGIRHQQANTSADVNGHDLGNGTLFIAESCVTWQKDNEGLGFTVQYPSISCHAISRDLAFFPHECLHLVIEGAITAGDAEAQDKVQGEDEGGPAVSDVRFIPLNKDILKQMFVAMSYCQGLHPDPMQVQVEEEDEELEELLEGQDGDYDEEHGYEYDYEEDNTYFDSAEDAAHLSAAGRAQLARLDALLQSGQADGPCPANGHPEPEDPAGDADTAGSEPGGQFQDADME